MRRKFFVIEMKEVFTGAALVAFGMLEGYSFLKCGMVSPQAVIDQMSFKSMIVMKLFVSAVGTSMVAQSAMDYLYPKQFAASRRMSMTSVGYPRAMGGCFLLGIGMGLSGSGPTIIPAQLASGAGNLPLVAAGALAGGTVYSLVEKTLFSADTCTKPGAKNTIDARMATKYHRIAAPLGLAMVAATVALEQVWSNAADQRSLGFDPSTMWNPILAGVVIGLNQIPLRVLANHGQGGSTSVMNMIAWASGGKIAGQYRPTSVQGAAQWLYVWIGTSLGVYLGVKNLATGFTAPEGTAAERAFVGGALQIIGARVAMGCTCGHGISGFSELSFQSIAAAASIFSGGIATAMVMKSF